MAIRLVLGLILVQAATGRIEDHEPRFHEGHFDEHQIINVQDLTHKIKKRSTIDDVHDENRRQVKFKALGRDFRFMLRENKQILSPNFKVFVVDGDNERRRFHGVSQNEYYHGHLHGNPESRVSGHIDSSSGLMTFSVHDRVNQEVIHIEPLDRHRSKLVDPKSGNSSLMVVYKDKPIDSFFPKHKNPEDHYCDYVKFNETSFSSIASDSINNEVHSRSKRQVSEYSDIRKSQTRCSLYLVADHFFFKHMSGNLKATISFMVSAIDRVNQMYLSTNFGDPTSSDHFTGLGFVVHEIQVHETASTIETHYNYHRKYIRVRELLESFSNNIYLRNYCLGHLFTHRRFDNGVLGLAYVAHNKKFVPGGICSVGINRGNQEYFYNTGLTTFMNTLEQTINTRISDLVTAHELAHNWGAEHDPQTDECSPQSNQGGSYIMHTYSVAGYDDFNRKFSPCSIRSMHQVIMNRAPTCFIKPSDSFCGNGIKEAGEECDAGRFGEDSAEDPDDCCDSQCKLKAGADCSYVNSRCCTEFCKIARRIPPVICREPNSVTCQEETVCDGLSAECPKFGFSMKDNAECIDGGKCRHGRCISFCESIGKLPCLCTDTRSHPRSACHRCCRDGFKNSTCQPVNPPQELKDGTPCYTGICEKGICEKLTQDVTHRLWSVIDSANVNALVRFLRDNIIGAVIILTGMFWLPFCYFIKDHDRQKRRERDIKRAGAKNNTTRAFGKFDHRNPANRRHLIVCAGETSEPMESIPLKSMEGHNGTSNEKDTLGESGFASNADMTAPPQEPFGPHQSDAVFRTRTAPRSRPPSSIVLSAPIAEIEENSTPTSQNSARAFL